MERNVCALCFVYNDEGLDFQHSQVDSFMFRRMRQHFSIYLCAAAGSCLASSLPLFSTTRWAQSAHREYSATQIRSTSVLTGGQPVNKLNYSFFGRHANKHPAPHCSVEWMKDPTCLQSSVDAFFQHCRGVRGWRHKNWNCS